MQRERLLEILVWLVFGVFVCWVVVIVAAQNSYGLGPFVVNPQVPHEGRYVFAGLVQLLALVWGFALAFEVLKNAGISILYVLVSPSKRHSFPYDVHAGDLRKLAAVLSLLFLAGSALYTGIFVGIDDRVGIHSVPVAPVVLQFLTWIIVILPLVLPFPLPLWTQRKRFLQNIALCFSEIFAITLMRGKKVKLHHILIADSMTSATLMLWDLCYALCHFSTTDWTFTYVTGSDGALTADACGTGANGNPVMKVLKTIVYCIPFWIRLVQCLAMARYYQWKQKSHAVNAGKYLSSLAVILSSASLSWVDSQSRLEVFAYAFWILTLVVKFIYCYAWDVRMDWGLGRRGERGRWMLRHLLSFRPWCYYLALFTNLLGRISWALAISPNFCGEPCTLTLSIIEIARRSQWIVYRVEFAYTQQQAEWDRNSDTLAIIRNDDSSTEASNSDLNGPNAKLSDITSQLGDTDREGNRMLSDSQISDESRA